MLLTRPRDPLESAHAAGPKKGIAHEVYGLQTPPESLGIYRGPLRKDIGSGTPLSGAPGTALDIVSAP